MKTAQHRVGRIVAVVLLCLYGSVAVWAPAAARPQSSRSGVVRIEVDEVTSAGIYGGQPYVRMVGMVHGVVGQDEDVAGLDALPVDDDGRYAYSTPFEIIRPERGGQVAVVEAENRGNPLMIQLFNDFVGGSGSPSTAAYPDGFGNAFLFEGRRAYARVSWQTGIVASVPATAQGIGEVIVRDFGRVLRDGRTEQGRSPLGRYRFTILSGWSQGAWFVDTFVAEGFNADPSSPRRDVYDGALALSGAGNWLALNGLADDGGPQDPYLRRDRAPLTSTELLRRPHSDPVFVDIANYTDFYRIRAGLGGLGDARRYHRYDWPSAHGPSFFVTDALVFGTLGCNDGQVVPLNPVDFRPYLRAALVNLETEVGASVVRLQRSATRGLPADELFVLGGPPAASAFFNPLPGVATPVPATDQLAQPLGGVRFPELELPLGRPQPVALPPVSTASISAICGNIGGWQPAAADEIITRWPTVDVFAAAYAERISALVHDGFVLALDAAPMVATARARYDMATS